MTDKRISLTLAKVATIVSVIVGVGIIASGTIYILDVLYVPRSELIEFRKDNQTKNTEMLTKLSALEGSMLTLTKIFLKGEIDALNRAIIELEAILERSIGEENYLQRLKNDRTGLQIQLNGI